MRDNFSVLKNNKFKICFTCFFISLPAIIYFLVVNHFAVNKPHNDDYPAILQFLSQYKAATFNQKIALLFSQYNEHRIFFTRLIIAIYYSIFGNVNFINIIFIGNLQLVAILLISIGFIKKALPSNWELPSVLTSLFIFDLSGWQNADWAMASLQNYSIIFLLFASLHFYNSNRKSFYILGFIFQVLSTFSSGNGIIASFSIMLFAILRKEKVLMLFSISAFLIFSPLYFIHYQATKADHNNIVNMLNYFLHIVSGHIFIGRRNYNTYMIFSLSVLYLIALAIFFPIGKKIKIEKENLPFICILIFLLGTIVVITRYRVVSGFVPSRYMIYPNLLTALVFIFYCIKCPDSKFKRNYSIVFTILMLFCYERNFKLGYGAMKGWRYDIVHEVPDPWTYVDPAIYKAIGDESCRLKIYCDPINY